jgi:hypothetical protein
MNLNKIINLLLHKSSITLKMDQNKSIATIKEKKWDIKRVKSANKVRARHIFTVKMSIQMICSSKRLVQS